VNIGIILDELSTDLQKALLMIEEVGIKWVELRTVNNRNIAQLEIEEAREFSQMLKKNNLQVCAISSPLLKCFFPGEEDSVPVGDQFGFHISDYSAHLSIVDHLMDIGEIFGTSLLRVFTFWKATPTTQSKIDKIAELMIPLANKACDRGFTLCVENEPDCYVQKAVELHSLLDRLDSANVKALWDPGNAKLVGEAEEEGYENIKDMIVHVHLKDFRSVKDEVEFALPGTGEVDIALVMNLLAQSDYEGVVSLEPCRGGLTLEEFKCTVDRLKRFSLFNGGESV